MSHFYFNALLLRTLLFYHFNFILFTILFQILKKNLKIKANFLNFTLCLVKYIAFIIRSD